MSDFSVFNLDNFDLYNWVNDTISTKRQNEDLDTFLSSVSMKLQLLSQECSDRNEEQMKLIMERLPSVIKEVSLYASQLDSIKTGLKELNTKVGDAEENEIIRKLSQLKFVQTNMSICKKQLDSLSEWDQSVKNIDMAIANNEIENSATLIKSMNDSFALLEQLPNQEERRKTIQTYKEKLCSIINEKYRSALKNNVLSELQFYKNIYSQIDENEYFISVFAEKCQEDLVALWPEALSAESDKDTLSIFWGSFYNYICILEETKIHLFGSNNDFVTSCIYTKAFPSLVEPITDYLKSLSVLQIPSILDTSFHYIDILSSSISTPQYKEECIRALFSIFIYYINHYYSQKEVELFNESVMKLEEHQPIQSEDLSESIQSLYDYVLSYCHFIVQLKTLLYSLLDRTTYISNSALLGTFVNIVNILMESLSTKYTTVFNQIQKYSQVESNKITIENFSWEIYKCSLCYNYIIDHIVTTIKDLSESLVKMIQTNKEGYLDALNSTSFNESNEDIKQYFFTALCQDIICQEDLKNIIHLVTVSTPPVFFTKSINIYKSLLSESTNFIYKLYSIPIKTALNVIPTLDIWMDTSASPYTHTLPSDYIMPLGEYLLKFVEQIEVSYNLLSDSLSNTNDTLNNTTSLSSSISNENRTENNTKNMMMSADWLNMYESLVEKDNKKIEQLFDLTISYNQKNIIVIHEDENEDLTYVSFINSHLYLLTYIVLFNFYESIFLVQRAKYGGIKQLTVDSQYLLNVLNAFDCGTPVLLEDLIFACQFNDAELSDAIGRISSSDNTQSNIILKKIGKFRGILGC